MTPASSDNPRTRDRELSTIRYVTHDGFYNRSRVNWAVNRRRALEALGGATVVLTAGCLQTDPAVTKYEEGVTAFERGLKNERDGEQMSAPYRNPRAKDRFRTARDSYVEAANHFERSMQLAESAKLSNYGKSAMLRSRGEAEEMKAAIDGDRSDANSAESEAKQHTIATVSAVKQAAQKEGFLF